ncbi:MAG: hypothetical protein AAF927_11485 [Bacteroidota bacterium]
MLAKGGLSSSTFLIISLLALTVCSPQEAPKAKTPPYTQEPYAEISLNFNRALNFDTPKAINAIVRMENQYFETYEDSVSPFYGTLWRENLEADISGKKQYERYRSQMDDKADSMHCTIYAVKALKAGMGNDFAKLENAHRKIWGDREHAGWSIGYLLVRDWGWKAYSIIDTNSQEFAHCQRSFQRNQRYPVWRQPDIPLEAMYIRGRDDSLIINLLSEHEFGWGFSDQGYHTWITRFKTLKECNWLGAPGQDFEKGSSLPLFLRTPFLEYEDYASHVLIVPPLAPKTLSFNPL